MSSYLNVLCLNLSHYPYTNKFKKKLEGDASNSALMSVEYESVS